MIKKAKKMEIEKNGNIFIFLTSKSVQTNVFYHKLQYSLFLIGWFQAHTSLHPLSDLVLDDSFTAHEILDTTKKSFFVQGKCHVKEFVPI